MSAGRRRSEIVTPMPDVGTRGCSPTPRSLLAGIASAVVGGMAVWAAAPAEAQPRQPQQQPQPQSRQPQQPQQQPQPQQAQQQPQPRQQEQEQPPPQGAAQQSPQQPAEQQATQPQQTAAADGCGALADHVMLTDRLREIVVPGDPHANGGLGNHVWAVTVDRAGVICAITRSGQTVDDQWLGSRAIAASKAFTANAFSLPRFALSTANLYWPSQPESSLYDLGFGNPINPLALYSGDASSWGTPDDPLIGRRIGGTTVFGGGLALYSRDGDLLGGIGVSGEESCTDHVIAWRLRHAINLDNVPNGPTNEGNDNIVYDLTVHPATGQRSSASGYGHPVCSPTARTIAEQFAETAPTGPEE